MLDPKHKNIAATASMLRLIGSLSPEDDMYKEIASLFMLESDECSHKDKTGQCTLTAEDDMDSFTMFPCCIGECPLGRELDDELKFGCDPEEDRMQLYGKNTMSYGKHIEEGPGKTFGAGYGWSLGGHTHIGYTGWRKYWDKFKRSVDKVCLEWMPYMLISVVVVVVVWVTSAAAGWYSIDLF